MCKQPSRSWREFAPRSRIGYAALSVLLVTAAVIVGRSLDDEKPALALLFLGGAIAVLAVILPSVQQMEFGFPVIFNVVAAVQSRDARIREALELQRGELALCTQLLCADPARAKQLLEASWSQLTTTWRRPVGPALRLYAWCLLVHLLVESERLGAAAPVDSRGPARLRLDSLDFRSRVLVVLHAVARLTIEEIATLVDRPAADVEADLQAAEVALQGTGA